MMHRFRHNVCFRMPATHCENTQPRGYNSNWLKSMLSWHNTRGSLIRQFRNHSIGYQDHSAYIYSNNTPSTRVLFSTAVIVALFQSMSHPEAFRASLGTRNSSVNFVNLSIRKECIEKNARSLAANVHGVSKYFAFTRWPEATQAHAIRTTSSWRPSICSRTAKTPIFGQWNIFVPRYTRRLHDRAWALHLPLISESRECCT